MSRHRWVLFLTRFAPLAPLLPFQQAIAFGSCARSFTRNGHKGQGVSGGERPICPRTSLRGACGGGAAVRHLALSRLPHRNSPRASPPSNCYTALLASWVGVGERPPFALDHRSAEAGLDAPGLFEVVEAGAEAAAADADGKVAEAVVKELVVSWEFAWRFLASPEGGEAGVAAAVDAEAGVLVEGSV